EPRQGMLGTACHRLAPTSHETFGATACLPSGYSDSAGSVLHVDSNAPGVLTGNTIGCGYRKVNVARMMPAKATGSGGLRSPLHPASGWCEPAGEGGCQVTDSRLYAGIGRVSITPPLTAPHASWGAQVHVLPDGVDRDL